MSTFADKMKGMGATNPHAKREGPLWLGPEADGPNGGISFSMLSNWLVCRERFRVKYIEGLRPTETFNVKIEYGNFWHEAEEALAKCRATDPNRWFAVDDALEEYGRKLKGQYPLQVGEIDRWTTICGMQFREYQAYWARHPDVQERKPLLSEQVFDVPYKLPSGRTVRLRGKWDSVDLVGNGIWLQENKTKGDIKEDQIGRQLTYDLQTMMYVIALGQGKSGVAEIDYACPIAGVRYNVIRRPLSGGKGSIKQKQPSKSGPGETDQEYMDRLRQYFVDEPEAFFMRWNVPITPTDIERFRRQTLDPVLEQLCKWYDGVKMYPNDPFINAHHYTHPFGVYNVLNEGGSTDLDEYIMNGSRTGLHATEQLFTELQE